MADDLRALLAALVESVDALPFEFNWKGEPSGSLADFDVGPLERARAALAEGAVVGVTDEELWKLFDAEGGNPEDWGWTLVFLRAVLARYGTTHPRPIPVAERLPTEADCDAEGRCWFWESYMERWELDDRTHGINLTRVAWLPAAAIPLPEVEP